MTNKIVPDNDVIHPIPALFGYLGVEKVKPKDKFTIEYADGFLTATIKRPSGGVEVIRKFMKGGFSEITTFDPNTVSRDQRDEVIGKLRQDGLSQSEIARRTGFSQSTVSNVLRKQK